MTRRSQGTYVLCGERFSATCLDKSMVLTHPYWPLTGSGPTLQDAVADLTEQSAELLSILDSLAYAALNEQARAMLTFQRRLSEKQGLLDAFVTTAKDPKHVQD